MADTQRQSSLTKEQKTGFVLLLVFGILAVGFGFLQMRNTIYHPFIVRTDTQTEQLPTLLDETARLQRIDTDLDGIHDYEELNFYRTSPYLPDTDSDGVSDKDEIDLGTDPLCPEGTQCSGEEESGDTQTESLGSPLVENTATPADIIGSIGASGGSASGTADGLDFEALLTDPDALRELLLATGNIDKADLDQIPDDQLLELARGLLLGGQ